MTGSARAPVRRVDLKASRFAIVRSARCRSDGTTTFCDPSASCPALPLSRPDTRLAPSTAADLEAPLVVASSALGAEHSLRHSPTAPKSFSLRLACAHLLPRPLSLDS